MKYSIHILLTMLLIFSLPMSARSETYPVPDQRSEIQVALDELAGPGDTLIVSNRDPENSTVAYQPFTMESGVKVLAAPGQSPIVDGASAVSYAVDWPASSSNTTILRGFTVRGGTSAAVRIRDEGVIESCTVEKTSAPSGFNAIRSIGSTTIDECSVSVLGAYTNYAGIYQTDGTPNITGCSVYAEDGYGIRVNCPSATTGGTVSNCAVNMDIGTAVYVEKGSFVVDGVTVEFNTSDWSNTGIEAGYSTGLARGHIQNCFVSAVGGLGVAVVDDSVKVHNITVDTVYEGFDGYDQTVSNCIVTNHYNYAFRDVNAEYCIADGDPAFETGSAGTGSKNEDPLYCDADGDEYTLRVDSWGNPEINGHGLIGAFPVACMFGTLQRDAEFTVGGTLEVTGDVVVPDTTNLTLGEDTILDIADSDGESGKVALIVEGGGSLMVEGTSGHLVQFGSTGTEGDWYGVHVEQGGSASIEYAEIRDATYGVIYQGSETGSISYSSFSNNEVDIYAGAVYDDMDLAISHNTLSVGGGVGILWVQDVTGATVDTNEITGSGGSSSGIKESTGTGGAAPTYTGNTISGLGTGIWNGNSDAVMTTNTITSCGYGIRVTYGSPEIGTDSDSDNVIQGNTYAILCDGTGTPVIRNNQLSSNFVGVAATNGAAPDMGTGTGGNAGNNTLTGYSNPCIANLNPSGTLSAQGNYFGGEGCSAPTCTYGSVDVSNWLCTQPAGAEMALRPSEPQGFHLLGVGPNPMAGFGKVYFSLGEGEARVHGHVFDVSGRVVRNLGETVAGPGLHVLDWDGRNNVGTPVRSGIYFVRVEATNGFQGTTKVLVTR